MWIAKFVNVASGLLLLHQIRRHAVEDINDCTKNSLLLEMISILEAVLMITRTNRIRPTFDRNNPNSSMSFFAFAWFLYVVLLSMIIISYKMAQNKIADAISESWDFTWDQDKKFYETLKASLIAWTFVAWFCSSLLLLIVPPNGGQQLPRVVQRREPLAAAA